MYFGINEHFNQFEVQNSIESLDPHMIECFEMYFGPV